MRTPVLLLGSQETALAVARGLARRGLRVSVSGPHLGSALRSRHCHAGYGFADSRQSAARWGEMLLGADATRFAGHVVLATSDPAIEFIAHNHAALERRYCLDMPKPGLQLALLDKQRSLELGREAGVGTPGFWPVDSPADLERVARAARYPALVKPIHSHVFMAAFGRKNIAAYDAEDLVRKARPAIEANIRFMVCEMIAGPDSLLSSYYTYLMPGGEALFHFTKRILRRFPANEGGATYHLTEWLPRTAEAGRRFLAGIGFEGLANVEFKLDRRDGELKLIECNARFTAAQALVAWAGVDTAWISYCRATGVEPPRIAGYREQLCSWVPEADFRAYRQLRRQGRLTTAAWLRSLARPKIAPQYDLADPWPGLVHAGRQLRGLLAKPRAALAGLCQGLLRRLATAGR